MNGLCKGEGWYIELDMDCEFVATTRNELKYKIQRVMISIYYSEFELQR
jgi:hypothetical protein